jgi:hypothetical protein
MLEPTWLHDPLRPFERCSRLIVVGHKAINGFLELQYPAAHVAPASALGRYGLIAPDEVGYVLLAEVERSSQFQMIAELPEKAAYVRRDHRALPCRRDTKHYKVEFEKRPGAGTSDQL